MARQALRYQVLDNTGVPIAGVAVNVYDFETTTPITPTMYTALTGPTAATNPLETDASGRVEAWIDEADAVTTDRVTLTPVKTGFTFTSRGWQFPAEYGALGNNVAPISATTLAASGAASLDSTLGVTGATTLSSTLGVTGAITGSSTISGTEFIASGPVRPAVSTDPGTPVEGDIWYNTTGDVIKYYDGTTVQTLITSAGDITEVVAGDGLSGGAASGIATLNAVGGNAISVDATDIEVTINAAADGTGDTLASTDQILFADADATYAVKKATIAQIKPTLLSDTANSIFYTANSTGQVTALPLSATSGTVLTSNGSASAPTWEAAAGGSEITLNSSAAIALGKFVVLETAGTVKEVASSTSINLTFGTKWISTIGTALQWGQQEPSVTWDATRNVFWITCMQAASTNLITYIMEIDSAGVVTMTQKDIFAASAAATYGTQASCHDTTNDKLVLIFVHSNGYFYINAAPLSGTGNTSTVGTWEGIVLLTSSYYNWTGVPVKAIYVPAVDRTYFFFTNHTQYAMVIIADTSGAAPGPVSIDYIDSSNTNQYYGYDAALAANGNICVVGGSNGGFAGMTAYNIIPYAGYMSMTGTTQVMTGPGGYGSTTGVAVVYDASQTKMVGYQVGNVAFNEAATWVLPATGAPSSVSTKLTVTSGTAFSYTGRVRPPLGYDDVNGLCVLGYVDSSTVMIQFDQIITSTTNPTMLGSPVVSDMSQSSWSNFGLGQGFTGEWVGFGGLWPTNPGGYAVSVATTTSTASAQIGVAQNAATGAAQAVTIKTVGALDETGTGMTIGDVYIDTNGNRVFASGSGTTLVGRAISATKLLITQTGSGTV